MVSDFHNFTVNQRSRLDFVFVNNDPIKRVDLIGLRYIEAWWQDYWQNVYSILENQIREWLGIQQGAAFAHYLKVWGETEKGCKFYAYGKDSAEGRYTYVPPGASYHLSVQGPIIGYKDSSGVQCITYTSEWVAFLGIKTPYIDLSITLVSSTISITICADGEKIYH